MHNIIYSVSMYDISVYFPKWAVMLDFGLKQTQIYHLISSFHLLYTFDVLKLNVDHLPVTDKWDNTRPLVIKPGGLLTVCRLDKEMFMCVVGLISQEITH